MAISETSTDTNEIWIALPPDPKPKPNAKRMGILSSWRQKAQPAPRESDAVVAALRCSGQI